MDANLTSAPSRGVIAWSSALPWLAVFGLAFTLRAPFTTEYPDTPDGVRLIRALDRFDVHDHSPHFPGYPAAVALARMLPIDGGLAWSWLGAIAGALACAFVGWACEPRVGQRGAYVGAIACALWPFAVGESVRIATDTLVLPFLFGALGLRARAVRPLLAGLLLGVGLGVRPSAAPWALGLFVDRGRARAALGLGIGILSWLVPTLIVSGATLYWDDGHQFVTGHFTRWGGTALSADSDLQTRASHMITHWIGEPLRFPPLGLYASVASLAWLLTGWTLLACKLHALRTRGQLDSRTQSLLPRPLFWGALAYGVWITVAQNPAHARHVLPLASLAIAVGAAAWFTNPSPSTTSGSDLGPRRRLVLALAAAVAATCMTSAVTTGLARVGLVPPTIQVLQRLAEHPAFDPAVDRVYAGPDLAFARWIGPHWDARLAADRCEVLRDARGAPLAPRRVWMTSFVVGSDTATPATFFAESPAWTSPWGRRASIHELEEPSNP